MKEGNNIENLFKDGLSGFESAPPESGWAGLQAGLNNSRLEHLAKAKLANNAMKPAALLWMLLSIKLFLKIFLHFKPYQFNVYYAVLVTAGITAGTIAYVSGHKSNTTNQQNTPQQTEVAILTEAPNPDNHREPKEIIPQEKPVNKPVQKVAKAKPTEEVKETHPNESINTLPSTVNCRLTQINLNTDDLSSYQPKDNSIKENKVVEEPSSLYSVGLYAGIMYWNQSFKYANSELNNLYKNQNSKFNLGYRFGIRANAMLSQKYMMQTGIYVANIKNQFTHIKNVNNTVTTQTYDNKYSYIEVPVLFGLHLEKNKFLFNLKTGPVFNCITTITGRSVLDAENNISRLHLSTFNSPGIRWELSPEVIYKVDDEFSIFIEPRYTYDVNKLFRKHYDTKSRFNGFTGAVGFYYHF